MNNIDETTLQKVRDELKKLLVKALSLEDVEPKDIADDEILFGAGLGLDSLDAVEIVVMLQRNYGIEIKNTAEAKEIFYSVDTLAKYVYENK